MSKHRFKIIIVGCLLVVIAVWALRPHQSTIDDEQRFRQMLSAGNWGWRLRSAERRLPNPLVRLLHISNLKEKYLDKAQAHENALFASGYLTKASISISNLPATATNEKLCRVEVQRRLQAGAHADYLSFYMETNQAVVTCRSRDLVLVRAAIQNP